MLAPAKLQVALDRPRQAMAHESEVDEARAHGHLLRAERVAVVPRTELLTLVEQGRPLHVVLFMIRLHYLLGESGGCFVLICDDRGLLFRSHLVTGSWLLLFDAFRKD